MVPWLTFGRASPDAPRSPGKELFTQLVRFQEVQKLANRGFIGHGLAPQINAHELPHGARIVQGLLHGWIRQIEPLLQTMEAQHAFDTHRRTPGAVGLGIHRLNDRHQVRPRYHAIHFIEESLAAGGFAIRFERGLGKCRLLHGRVSRSVLHSSSHITTGE